MWILHLPIKLNFLTGDICNFYRLSKIFSYLLINYLRKVKRNNSVKIDITWLNPNALCNSQLRKHVHNTCVHMDPKVRKERERSGKWVKNIVLGHITQRGLYMKPLLQMLTFQNTSCRFWCRKLVLNMMHMITRTVYYNNYCLCLEFSHIPSQQRRLDSSLGMLCCTAVLWLYPSPCRHISSMVIFLTPEYIIYFTVSFFVYFPVLLMPFYSKVYVNLKAFLLLMSTI